eukprot:evm.model.scf_89.4 EVM.evm.TU.scf_89.4   scf_89:8566-11639(+)
MAMDTITTNDGVKIAYEKVGGSGNPLVLIHGWSGSRRYFDLNVRDLATAAVVYRLDLRFHGDSDKPQWGFHIARLAADLQNFLEALDLTEVTLLGTSMGASIIWSYFELFDPGRVSKAVFVDQAPLQNRADDWDEGKASKGCYDAKSLAQLQMGLKTDFPKFAKLNTECCITLPLDHAIEAVVEGETLKCQPDDLARLMADHTQLDWRPMLPRIKVDCLNCIGQTSGVFPPDGPATVGNLIPSCTNVFFQASNHWLYLEEPAKFNNVVINFIKRGNQGRPKSTVV